MAEEKTMSLPQAGKGKDMYMQADIIDQVNTNQQSNMTLSAYSVITQSDSCIKINSGGDEEFENEQ